MSSSSSPSTSLTFYHAPQSTSNVTVAILAELSQPYPSPSSSTTAIIPPVQFHQIELSIPRHETRSQNYLRTINPNGRVPAILHNGTSIWESAAISMYLGETFGVERGLYPELSPKRGEAMKWIVWTNTTLTPAGGKLAAAMPVGAPGGVEEGSQDVSVTASAATEGKGKGDAGEAEVEVMRKKAAEDAKKEIVAALKVLNGALVEREYLLGEKYTLADTHVWCFVDWLGIMGVGLDEVPAVKEWAGRVGSRPSLKDV